ncbi:MAG TPA: hypothetical protein VKK79_01855 [Candidatus Lokiarchaeia archaeon]|nr:hypothetical protein [Candidatus Lokiarchaeia archaeon]
MAYFEALNELYISAQKEGAAVHGLWDNLNYLGKLTPPRQRKPVKVVMMGTGTIIKACIVQDPSIIIDYSNFFVGLDDLEEAYFLCGFLNAPAVTQTVRVIIDEGAAGSGRNIMKRPFSIRLPRYDVENELHQEIVKMALNMERHARKILDRWITGEEEKLKLKDKGENSELDAIFNKISLKKLALQNRIYKELGWDTKKSAITGEFAQLNQLIREVISRKGK